MSGPSSCLFARPGLLLLGLLLLFPGLARADCVTGTCHADLAGGQGLHAPVADGDCDGCHQSGGASHPGKESMSLVAAGAELCLNCHDDPRAYRFVHGPVADGDCIACHDPHRPGDGAKAVASLCGQCHETGMQNVPVQHGPVAVGDCLSCHRVHASPWPKLLVEEGAGLCFRCHEDFSRRMRQAKVVHAAIEGQGCTGCHTVHGGGEKHLLGKKRPELCLDCHQDVGDAVGRSRVGHAALQRPESCGVCHQTHFSGQAGLLNGSVRDICLRCHGVDDNRRSHPLRNIATEIDGKQVLHGPVADGDCGACHRPHGSDFFRLLSGNYPSEFYSPYKKGNYDFCLQCHDGNMLRFADTSLYTNFRDGKRNLHYLHVANPVKGRTCRVCHQPHAGDSPKLIRTDGVPFGEWTIPIRFRQTETGGSCMPGCHRQESYDREKPLIPEKG
ncbi:MAG: cytochrome c3 family protein [Geothermobacteraceae bacterium]